ncbi:MAG: cobalt transporter CbiM [Chthoniobacterales bacterium]|nr:cobalt transporter CbiM [Chthoniobacterales bacterium]
MHIPDGYLSPSTCAVMYGGALPFWTFAARRLRQSVGSRLVPLLSVFAAFSFVVMMFNLPLPGGTTGHAVGMGIGAIVLGPWAAMLAISIALLIQALFFGDGGITAYGANCFNMAIVGSLVSYGIYRAFAGHSPLTAPRRVFAAGCAGYVAINVSALLAAIEFGIQPLLFHDAAGAPLYAPYPLRIAIPAMLVGHLTFAGIAELIISAGVVAWLQRAEPALLARSAPNAVVTLGKATASGRESLRRLWVALAALMILTPLGLLAAGTAWGEWSAKQFQDPANRRAIAAASFQTEVPSRAPAGLEKLSTLWTAPFPAYAPPFLKSASLGYILSAVLGTGLIIAACLGFGWGARLLAARF